MTPAGLDENRAVQLLIVFGGKVVRVGSGYLAAADLVLTAAHVVSGADKVTVRQVTGWRQVTESDGDMSGPTPGRTSRWSGSTAPAQAPGCRRSL